MRLIICLLATTQTQAFTFVRPVVPVFNMSQVWRNPFVSRSSELVKAAPTAIEGTVKKASKDVLRNPFVSRSSEIVKAAPAAIERTVKKASKDNSAVGVVCRYVIGAVAVAAVASLGWLLYNTTTAPA